MFIVVNIPDPNHGVCDRPRVLNQVLLHVQVDTAMERELRTAHPDVLQSFKDSTHYREPDDAPAETACICSFPG